MLPPSKDGWGDRIYSVVLERGNAASLSDGWVGLFPVALNENDVKAAVIAHIAGRGYGAPEVRI